ncbi:MAG: hypothetical protein P8N14_15295 [Sulfitobacter sp.]|jgi:hypothetical protein|nr:hypothetical protein [Sulfitobacter sp.]
MTAQAPTILFSKPPTGVPSPEGADPKIVPAKSPEPDRPAPPEEQQADDRPEDGEFDPFDEGNFPV